MCRKMRRPSTVSGFRGIDPFEDTERCAARCAVRPPSQVLGASIRLRILKVFTSDGTTTMCAIFEGRRSV